MITGTNRKGETAIDLRIWLLRFEKVHHGDLGHGFLIILVSIGKMISQLAFFSNTRIKVMAEIYISIGADSKL